MTIDPSTITQVECEERKFPMKELGLDQRPPGFQIVVRRSVLNEIKKFGRASKHAEVGGMFVGFLCWDDGPFVVVEAAIEGKYTDNRSSSVTFTSQTWDYVHEQKDRLDPKLKIVGWYHTHPSFGVFLSKYDLFICRETFNAPFHIAYVFDPHIEDRSASEGFFVWKNSRKISVKPHVLEDIPSVTNRYSSHVWRIDWKSVVQKPEAESSATKPQEPEGKIRIVLPPEPEPIRPHLPLVTPKQTLATPKSELVAAIRQILATHGTSKPVLDAIKRALATPKQMAEPIPPKKEQTATVPQNTLDVTG